MPAIRALFLLFVCLPIGSAALSAEPDGPLKTYVEKPDTSYRWIVRREGKVGSSSYAELILTSQTWRDIPWKHQLFVLKPAKVAPPARHALLLISGGSWRDELQRPPADDERLPGDARAFAQVAEILGTPVAVLRHVPHQPILGGL
jgi:hypothetical protein